jgi:two-component system, OmpR family, phosphate regulon response regulator OmpR
MLSMLGTPEDPINGFEADADDYLLAPFGPRGLVLRIRAMLRPAPAPGPEAPPGLLALVEPGFNAVRGERSGPNVIAHLTGGGDALLTALAQSRRSAVARGDCLARGTAESSERAIGVQVTRLQLCLEAGERNGCRSSPRFARSGTGSRGRDTLPGATRTARIEEYRCAHATGPEMADG